MGNPFVAGPELHPGEPAAYRRLRTLEGNLTESRTFRGAEGGECPTPMNTLSRAVLRDRPGTVRAARATCGLVALRDLQRRPRSLGEPIGHHRRLEESGRSSAVPSQTLRSQQGRPGPFARDLTVACTGLTPRRGLGSPRLWPTPGSHPGGSATRWLQVTASPGLRGRPWRLPGPQYALSSHLRRGGRSLPHPLTT